MQEENLIYWLWLVMVMGIADSGTVPLLKTYPDIVKLYYLIQEQECTFLSPSQKKRAAQIPVQRAQEILTECTQKQISLMTYDNEYYPQKLKNIYNPPALLFYRGNPAFLKSEKILTAVGTRHPSEYSVRTVQKLYAELVRKGCTLTSGFAVGLDTEANLAAVKVEAPTIAVLGCGLDCNYPKGSQPLKEKIAETGLLLTEYFPGTPPYGRNFPVRNRILAGISDAVLVTEAGLNSGCMITANLACEQGKTVFCIPPNDIFSSRYAGQIKLLREGASAAFSAEDIIEELDSDKKKTNSDEKNINPHPQQPPSVPTSAPETEVQPVVSEKMITTDAFASLMPEEQKIMEALKDSEKNINMLCCLTGMKFETVSMHLIELEMMGYLTSSGNDFYKISESYH